MLDTTFDSVSPERCSALIGIFDVGSSCWCTSQCQAHRGGCGGWAFTLSRMPHHEAHSHPAWLKAIASVPLAHIFRASVNRKQESKASVKCIFHI